MMPVAACDYMPTMSLLDYSYLSLNVYHYPSDMGLLGSRPVPVFKLENMIHICNSNKEGWHQIQTPHITLSTDDAFYADLYAKIIRNKILHVAIAIRGTVFSKPSNDWEDIRTWYKAVVENETATLQAPSFFARLHSFINNCKEVIEQLEAMQLLSHHCSYHITGHSLGGALANLVSASGISLMHMPFDVVSFNAPGIGSMQGVLKDGFHEGQVVSMRATYDFMSAISEAYGYVINVKVPKDYALAKEVFSRSRQQDFSIKEYILELFPLYEEHKEIETSVDFLVSVHAQHSMNNLLMAIAADHGLATLQFQQLRAFSKLK